MGGGSAFLLIALPSALPEHIVTSLHNKFPHLEIKVVQTSWAPAKDELYTKIPLEIWRQVTILVTFRALPPDPVNDAPNLELIHLCSAGSNHIATHPVFTDTDITITTSTGIHGPQIAEWVIMTGLAQSHHLRLLYEQQKKHAWNPPEQGKPPIYRQVQDKAGRRIGILGYGSIGRQVGRVASALGMDVLAYTATPKNSAESRRDHGYIVPGTGDANGEYPSAWYSGLDKQSLHHFLSQDLDWVVVAVPLTKDTTHLLGKEEFKTLSQSGKKPFLTNIARGAIIKTDELVEALKDGTLGGAALDVTDPEPLPADHELWDTPGVLITPHISGLTDVYFDRAFGVLELNLQRRERGEKLVNVVRREKGY